MASVSVGCLLVTRLPVKAALFSRPELTGRPFAVYCRDGRVLGASPEAAGVRVGAPLSEALAAGAEPVAADDTAVAAIHKAVFESLCGCVPGVEPAGEGVFYLDIRGMAEFCGSIPVLAGRILDSRAKRRGPGLGWPWASFRLGPRRWRRRRAAGKRRRRTLHRGCRASPCRCCRSRTRRGGGPGSGSAGWVSCAEFRRTGCPVCWGGRAAAAPAGGRG